MLNKGTFALKAVRSLSDNVDIVMYN